MKNQIMKASLLGVAGAAILTLNGATANAAVFPMEHTYVKTVATVEQTDDTTGDNSNSLVEAAGKSTLAALTAVSEDEEAKKREDLISNMKYECLGIANVDNYLNIRKKPGETSKVIGKLPKHAGCDVLKTTKDGWSKIKSGKVTGYVKSSYLVTGTEAEELALKVGNKMATVQTQTLNVRFLPSTDSAKYTLVPIGEEMEVTKEKISASYMDTFLEKHFSKKSEKELIKDVDTTAMKEQLDDWYCVSIDDEKVFVSKEFVTISYQLDKAVPVEELKKEGTKEVSSVRAQMVEYSKQFLGNPYVWGGTSLTNGTDCSGFVMRIYEHFGYAIPRNSRSQAAYCKSISASELKPGDLIFYGNGSTISHVAMYIGNGMVIHASTEKTGIKISNAFYRTPMKIGRVIND